MNVGHRRATRSTATTTAYETINYSIGVHLPADEIYRFLNLNPGGRTQPRRKTQTGAADSRNFPGGQRPKPIMADGRNSESQRIYQDSKHFEFVGGEFHGGQTFVSGGCLERSRRTEILEWISTIPYTSHHRLISEGRLEGTVGWIFEREEYCAWLSSSVSLLLLLRGIPGAGKTYVASKVIDSFLSNQSSTGFAYFYCNRAEGNRRDPESIMSALVHQLAQTESKEPYNLARPVIELYDERERRGQKSSRLSVTESQELLVQLVKKYPETTICIDALDEVEHEIRLKLLKALKYVIGSSKKVKIFATTRMDTDILLQFEMFPKIELRPDDNVADINRFINKQVQNAIEEKQLLHGVVPDELKDEICNVLHVRSKGMFQLAALQITSLCEMATQKDVAYCLKTLPETLTKAYDEIYRRISTQKGSFPRLALNAFRWLQCSYEPLRAETLLDAITADIDDSGAFSHYTIQPNDLLKACQNLLILDEALNVFRFAHLSVDEYMQRKLRRIDSQAEIAKVCLSLLCSPAWGDYDTALSTRHKCYSDRHLLLYSAVFWPWHFAQCGDNNDSLALTGLWNTFVTEKTHRQWLDYHWLYVRGDYFAEDTFWQRSEARNSEVYIDVLSTVCIYGLGRKFKTALQATSLTTGPTRLLGLRRSDLDRAHRLLLQACRFGDLDIARQLYAVDRRAHYSNLWGETPLQVASRRGQEALAGLVIDQGEEASASYEKGRAPLHLALEGGHEATAQLLINRGADFTTADEMGRTPLHLASLEGYEVMVQQLIGQGADVLATEKKGRTPLWAASYGGHEAVARLLIELGADLSAADTFGMTPLHAASFRGHEAVARLLIERGADLSAADISGKTPLYAAFCRNHEAVARLLIERGADVSASDEEGEAPLYLAITGGHEATALLLISQGADVTPADKEGRTLLHRAALKGYEVVVQQLIGQGADVLATDKKGRTPLHEACYGGHEAVARLLIERGADLSATDSAGWLPLQVASRGGHRTLIRLLRSHGAPWYISTVTGAPWPTPSTVRSEDGGDNDT